MVGKIRPFRCRLCPYWWGVSLKSPENRIFMIIGRFPAFSRINQNVSAWVLKCPVFELCSDPLALSLKSGMPRSPNMLPLKPLIYLCLLALLAFWCIFLISIYSCHPWRQSLTKDWSVILSWQSHPLFNFQLYSWEVLWGSKPPPFPKFINTSNSMPSAWTGFLSFYHFHVPHVS
jgi:hypothetical protein